MASSIRANPVKILMDPVANTMNIWWSDPQKAAVSEETESLYNNNVIIKDKSGVPVGIEIIGLFPEELNIVRLLKNKLSLNPKEPFLLHSSE